MCGEQFTLLTYLVTRFTKSTVTKINFEIYHLKKKIRFFYYYFIIFWRAVFSNQSKAFVEAFAVVKFNKMHRFENQHI